jgi:hypothetical protein
MKIQDSLYYQDFSYVIKVGQSINLWRDSFKKTIHTGGFYVTGQVNIETTINAGITSPVDGIVSGLSESPIFGILNTLFSTIFGRRLGTEDDGTTLRATPQLGVDPDFDDSTSEHFTPNTRDVTLKRYYTIKINSGYDDLYAISLRGNDYIRGYTYGGPRMKSLNVYDNPFGTDNMFTGTHTHARTTPYTATGPSSLKMITPLKMVNWADHKIIGVDDTINGTGVQIQDYAVDNLKTYISYPTEVTVTTPGFTFDRTGTTFDDTSFTFDKTF